MNGRPEQPAPRPPWIPPAVSWWTRLGGRVLLVSCVIIADPVRAARICARVLGDYRKDGDL